jgi:thiol-disulfide isomerase/thioredoxin
MKSILLIIGMTWALLTGAHGQKTNAVKERTFLQIGDTVPNIFIPYIQNYKQSSLRFSSFKDKWVILDFWFGTCKSCIEAFPKMEALQRQFGDKLQIVMVNFETQSKIDSTFSKWRKTSYIYRDPKLPSITSDTVLHQLFAVKYYPHEVWIDGNGVVRAFTSTNEVNENNITAMLLNQDPRMATKKDNLSFDDSKYPILPQVYDSNSANLKFYSVLMNYIPGVSGGLMRSFTDSVAGTVRVSRRNMSILELFGNALEDGMGGNPLRSPTFDFGKRIRLEIKDSSRYFYSPSSSLTKEQWQEENCYTYEAVVPLDQKDYLFSNMLRDLQRFFNLTYSIKKQKLKSLTLVRINNDNKIQSKRKASRSFFEKDTTKYQLDYDFIASFIKTLSEKYKSTPWIFVDKTDYKGRIDIELDKSVLANLPALKKILRKTYGLDLVETEEEINVTVLSEMKPAMPSYTIGNRDTRTQ